MNCFDVYLILKLDTFVIFSAILSTSILFLSVISIAALGNNWSEYKRLFLFLTIVFIISTIMAIFLPTTKQAAAMYVLPKIVNSETTKKDVLEIYDLGIKYLKDKLNGESK